MKTRNKTVATWLTFLGGPLGLHRFYLRGFGDLLGWMLLGSIPAIIAGTHLSSRMPDDVIRPILGVTLAALSVKFVFY